MKTQLQFEAPSMSLGPSHADRPDAYPALQLVQAGGNAATTDNRHDHILRATLLAQAGIFTAPYKQ